MKLLIVSSAPIIKKESNYYSYSPYVKEIELWKRYASETRFFSPNVYSHGVLLLAPFSQLDFSIIPTPEINSRDLFNPIKLFKIFFKLLTAMYWADHIHLRCPGNIGLLGSIAQIFFPFKMKTAKYAGNWDPRSRQPWSYRLQKWILRNTFLTHNMKVLVYGKWSDHTSNILPFFTASYSEVDKITPPVKRLNDVLQLIYVGALVPGKKPILALEVLQQLLERKIETTLNIYGDGPERGKLEYFVEEKGLGGKVILHGNQTADVIKKAYQQSHFLIFVSESEGWPKVIAEAMFWGCLPITSAVSCVPEMIGYGERGSLVSPSSADIVECIISYIASPDIYQTKVMKSIQWSQQFTLERFDTEIKQLIHGSKGITHN